MTKRLLELDDIDLADAAEQLGTQNMTETVRCAVRHFAEMRRVQREERVQRQKEAAARLAAVFAERPFDRAEAWR